VLLLTHRSTHKGRK